MLFSWKDSFSTGNKTIDEQHRELFVNLNSITDSSDLNKLNRVIMKLFTYTRKHFQEEEMLMKKINYPHREEHKKLHTELISGLNKLIETPFESTERIARFREFFYKWLVEHIGTHDKDLAHYIEDISK